MAKIDTIQIGTSKYDIDLKSTAQPSITSLTTSGAVTVGGGLNVKGTSTLNGPISYQGKNATYEMIKWIDSSDTYGNGMRIGGGGATIIGGGESASLPSVGGGDEVLYLMNDGGIDFYSSCQNGLGSAKHMTFDTSGNLNIPTNVVGSSNSNRLIFRHLDGQNCNGNYDLYLQYHQRNTKIYLNGTDYYIENGSYYNGTAAAANSVAWGNVSGKPNSFTPVSHTHTKSQITDFSHTHSKSEVGLGNVDNTADANKSVNYATSSHLLRTYGANNSSHGGDYYLKCRHNVDGNDRFKLQIIRSDGSVTHSTSVDYANSAGSAGSVAWGNVTGKPSTFPPIGHGHSEATQSGAGFMSSDDKKKLDGIAAGANKTVVDSSLSSSSNNPVRNSTIYSAFSNAAGFDYDYYSYGEMGSWRLLQYHATGNTLDIRHGVLTINAQEKTYSITFANPFNNNTYAIVCGIYRDNRNSWFWSPLITKRTNKGFSVYVRGNTSGDNSGTLFYIAIRSN